MRDIVHLPGYWVYIVSVMALPVVSDGDGPGPAAAAAALLWLEFTEGEASGSKQLGDLPVCSNQQHRTAREHAIHAHKHEHAQRPRPRAPGALASHSSLPPLLPELPDVGHRHSALCPLNAVIVPIRG